MEHDKDISHIILTSFVCSTLHIAFYLVSEDLLDSIIDHHEDAEITFSSHLDAESSNRENVSFNQGKALIVFPPILKSYLQGCFHAKLLLLRFSDRLRVVISSANLTMEDWETWSQCVWMQVLLLVGMNRRISSTHRRIQRVWRRRSWTWSFERS